MFQLHNCSIKDWPVDKCRTASGAEHHHDAMPETAKSCGALPQRA